MTRLYFPILISLALFITLVVKAFALPEGAVDCHTSDVPGCVTITFEDGSQQARPVALPAIQLHNSESSNESSCDGLVADPILWRKQAGNAWEPVIKKTFCQCVEFFENGHCKTFKGAC